MCSALLNIRATSQSSLVAQSLMIRSRTREKFTPYVRSNDVGSEKIKNNKKIV